VGPSAKLKLIHFSDIHFGGENAGALEAATAYASASGHDLLIITGDLTQFGAPAEFAAASAWLSRLPKPWLALPGNHDTPWWGLGARLIDPFGRFERAVGPADDVAFATPDLAVRSINSARGWQVRLNWSKGEVSRGQAERAARGLETSAPRALRVAACHHPLIEPSGEPITARVRGGRFAARRLQQAGVDLILSGHLHAPFVEALPVGDGRTYAVCAGTLSLRERGVPAGFNLIEVEESSVKVTALSCTPPGLREQAVWRVPLRPRPATVSAVSA
jgi:3',5'-cyclic AMP phosphodiesterase CpdA